MERHSGQLPSGMRARKSEKWIVLVVALVLAPVSAARGQEAALAGTPTMQRARRQVVVSILDRKLAVLENGILIRTFPVSVGAAISPSPVGEFQIVNRVANPTYYHPGVVIPSGPDNPIGPRWVGLNRKGYGIHGTNEPRSIGKAASHGCIRLRNSDVKQFFELVRVGDTVEIHGERDPQIAQIFEGVPPVAVANPATQTQAQLAAGNAAGGQ